MGNQRNRSATHFAVAVGVARFGSRSRGRCGRLRCVVVVVVMSRSSGCSRGAGGGSGSRSRVRIVSVCIFVGRVLEHARLAGPDDIVCVGVKGAEHADTSVKSACKHRRVSGWLNSLEEVRVLVCDRRWIVAGRKLENSAERIGSVMDMVVCNGRNLLPRARTHQSELTKNCEKLAHQY